MKKVKLPAPKDLPKRFDDLVRMYPPRALHDRVEYDNAQEIIDQLTSVHRLTKGQQEYLDTITILFAAYEQQNEPIKTGDISGLDALKYLMEQNQMTASDLGRLLGDRSLGSRILRGERALGKTHIRTLCERFHVSADLFFA